MVVVEVELGRGAEEEEGMNGAGVGKTEMVTIAHDSEDECGPSKSEGGTMVPVSGGEMAVVSLSFGWTPVGSSASSVSVNRTMVFQIVVSRGVCPSSASSVVTMV